MVKRKERKEEHYWSSSNISFVVCFFWVRERGYLINLYLVIESSLSENIAIQIRQQINQCYRVLITLALF